MGWKLQCWVCAILASLVASLTVFAGEVRACIEHSQTAATGRRPTLAYRNLVLEASLAQLKDRSISPKQISHLVDIFAHQGIPAIQLPDGQIPDSRGAENIPRERYMHGPQTVNRTLFGKAGEAGATIIDAPKETVPPSNPDKFHVPLHTHPSNHFTIVLAGEGKFLIFWNGEWKSIPVERGTMVFIPKGASHTFWAGQGIKVMAVAEQFHPTNTPEFAQRSALTYSNNARETRPQPMD